MITSSLAILTFPGASIAIWFLLGWHEDVGSTSGIISGEGLILLLATYSDMLAGDLSQFNSTDALPVAAAAALTYYLPSNRSVLLKVSGIIICTFGYCAYAVASSELGSVNAWRAPIETLVEMEFAIDTASPGRDFIEEKLVSVKRFLDGMRLFFLIAGGALLGLRIEKKLSEGNKL